jgi:hypothetical protein
MKSQAEIRRAERDRERGRRPVTILALRLAELNRLLTDRHRGELLSDDDSGRDDVLVVAHHLAHLAADPARKITSWIALRAPWMRPDEIAAVISTVLAKPRRWRADTLAKRLNVTQAERSRLRIKTIGACDATKLERAGMCRQRKLERQRERDRSRRRAAGRTPRAVYLVLALTNTRPWTADGISRRTWERRRAHVAGPRQHISA